MPGGADRAVIKPGYLFFFFEIAQVSFKTHFVAKDDLELLRFLPPPAKCRDYRLAYTHDGDSPPEEASRGSSFG